MKISVHTTLLLAFIFLALPCKSQKNQDKKYKSFYHSVNKAHGEMPVQTSRVADSDIIIEKITVAELDSVMKNLTGVTDIMQGGKSLLHPVVTLELDPYSSASQALFGCVEGLDRIPEVGKSTPEPKIQSFPMVKKTRIIAAVTPTSTKKNNRDRAYNYGAIGYNNSGKNCTKSYYSCSENRNSSTSFKTIDVISFVQ